MLPSVRAELGCDNMNVLISTLSYLIHMLILNLWIKVTHISWKFKRSVHIKLATEYRFKQFFNELS